MDILIALATAAAFALVFRTPLVRHSGVCYVCAVALGAVFLSGALYQVSPDLNRELLPFLRRAIFPYALFVVVMYIGVLPESSKLRNYLAPARGPLSVVAALMALCHAASYLEVYAKVALGGFSTAAASTASALVVAVVLSVLLAALAVTSLNGVRRRMGGSAWRAVQKFAYLFFGLVTLHAVVLLLPSATPGSPSLLAVSVYSGVFILYVILRTARWASSRAAIMTSRASTSDLSFESAPTLEG